MNEEVDVISLMNKEAEDTRYITECKCVKVLPPETASYGGGMSRLEKDAAGGRAVEGSSIERSSWTPYQLGQTEVCCSGTETRIWSMTHTEKQKHT